MNENDESNVPNVPSVPPPITPNPSFEVRPNLPPPKPNRVHRPLSWWLRKFFACNPFYLVSAALLIYGCYRISIDETFVDRETARLLFNFSSVQVYELLLVGVAIFSGRAGACGTIPWCLSWLGKHASVRAFYSDKPGGTNRAVDNRFGLRRRSNLGGTAIRWLEAILRGTEPAGVVVGRGIHPVGT